MFDIRIAKETGIDQLRDLGTRSFVNEFGALYTSENLTRFLQISYSRRFYEKLLKDNSLRCWVVEIDEAGQGQGGQLLGYVIAGANSIALEKTSITALPCSCGELKRLYVEDHAKGTGVAQKLMAMALTWLKQENLHPVFLSVYEDNLRAQKFYQRFGFAKVGEHTFKVGEHLDRDYIYCNQ